MWVFLEHVSGHKKKEVIGNNQHGFIKGKSCMTSLIAFYGKMAEFLNEGRTVDFFYLDFSKAFNSVSNNILVSRLGHDSLSGSRTRQLKDWLDGLKVVVNVSYREVGNKWGTAGIHPEKVMDVLLCLQMTPNWGE